MHAKYNLLFDSLTYLLLEILNIKNLKFKHFVDEIAFDL